VKQIRQEFEERKSKRHTFTEKEREDLHKGFKGKCNCCKKKVELSKMQIDHIEPLACGGTNDLNNLQVLCKPCHHEKTQEEKEYGYVKLSETESSFNLTTQEIFNSELSRAYAFVEYLCPESMAHKYKLKQYHIDINKCRANQLLYSNFDFPLFTVIDEPVPYSGDFSKPGLYFWNQTKGRLVFL
jgi:hypothetical protein